jgi:PASTA domain
MNSRRTALGAGIVVALALIAPAGAGAATLTIGSPLTSTFESHPAGNAATNAMVTGPNIASPVDGTVVNWRTQNFAGTFRVRILQLSGANAATAVASSLPINLSAGTVDNPLNLPIKKGQVVGFDNANASDRADVLQDSTTYLSAGWATLPDNGAPQAPEFNNEDLEFAYNATVRYCLVPDIVGKKVGAASQALSEAGCTLGTVTKKKAKKKKKKPKGPKIVKSQSVSPGTSLGDQAPVDVHVKVKPKKKKKK